MLRLINDERKSGGLAPVEMDEGAAMRAGQGHADDMAAHGFLGHWGTDGSVPEQRFTRAGGTDMVMENASCFTDGLERRLDLEPKIDPALVEHVANAFFDEQPPADGHRRNILTPWHRKVGIGVAQPLAGDHEIPAPCFAQEFVDTYGSYSPLPRSARVGADLSVSGDIDPPAVFAGIGLARVETPHPLAPHELNLRRVYPVPQPYQTYWPAGFQTPIPVRVRGSHFAIDVPLSDRGKPGLYELSVWAKLPWASEFVMVSLRTIDAR
jgi:hypothetical protein